MTHLYACVYAVALKCCFGAYFCTSSWLTSGSVSVVLTQRLCYHIVCLPSVSYASPLLMMNDANLCCAVKRFCRSKRVVKGILEM